MPTDILTVVVRGVDRTLLFIAGIGLIAMMLHISADIAMSLIFNRPIAVTSAIVTQYYMIAVAFLPIVAAELRGTHIGITLLTDLLPRGARRGLDTVVLALMAAVYALLTAQAWDQASDKWGVQAYMVEQTSRILVWPSFFMVPVAFGAMALLLGIKVLLTLSGRAHPLAIPQTDPRSGKEGDHV
jgi:TRAP-type C4-dicarboxylate transport system permease small subunit